jgi:hypothetical protein
MEELKTLRSEYARLKEFESKREVDSVQRLEESYDDARRLSDRFKEQFCKTKSELEDTRQLLCESEAREVNLNVEVEQLKKRIIEMDDEMKEQRLKSHMAALDAERNFRNEKKGIINKGRHELNELEEKLTLKIEDERRQHKDKMDRAEAQRTEIENNLSEQLTALREQQVEYQKIAMAKIAKRDQQIRMLSRNRESITGKSSNELVGDNDRLRRQPVSSFGQDTLHQNNLKELTSLCKTIQEDSRGHSLKFTKSSSSAVSRGVPPSNSRTLALLLRARALSLSSPITGTHVGDCTQQRSKRTRSSASSVTSAIDGLSAALDGADPHQYGGCSADLAASSYARNVLQP